MAKDFGKISLLASSPSPSILEEYDTFLIVDQQIALVGQSDDVSKKVVVVCRSALNLIMAP